MPAYQIETKTRDGRQDIIDWICPKGYTIETAKTRFAEIYKTPIISIKEYSDEH